MSDAGHAVFLSYASQDADAARRICETLRAAGIEVWFDQSELVGGDAWEWMLYANRYMCVGMPALIVLVAVLMQRAITSPAENVDQERAGFAKRFAYSLVASGLVLVVLNLYAKKFPEQGIAADQAVFDSGATAGANALDPLEVVVIAASLLMAVTCGWAVSRRLAEYR